MEMGRTRLNLDQHSPSSVRCRSISINIRLRPLAKSCFIGFLDGLGSMYKRGEQQTGPSWTLPAVYYGVLFNILNDIYRNNTKIKARPMSIKFRK